MHCSSYGAPELKATGLWNGEQPRLPSLVGIGGGPVESVVSLGAVKQPKPILIPSTPRRDIGMPRYIPASSRSKQRMSSTEAHNASLPALGLRCGVLQGADVRTAVFNAAAQTR